MPTVAHHIYSLGAKPFPIAARPHQQHEGVIDLIEMKAIYWDEESRGTEYEEREIPADMLDDCREAREILVEAAAEANDLLMDKYLNDGELSVRELKLGLRERTLVNKMVPALCGSAFKNKGVQAKTQL